MSLLDPVAEQTVDHMVELQVAPSSAPGVEPLVEPSEDEPVEPSEDEPVEASEVWKAAEA